MRCKLYCLPLPPILSFPRKGGRDVLIGYGSIKSRNVAQNILESPFPPCGGRTGWGAGLAIFSCWLQAVFSLNFLRQLKIIVIIICVTLSATTSALAEPAPVVDQALQDIAKDMRDTLSNRIAPEIAEQSDTLQAINRTVQNTTSGSSGVGGLNNMGTEQNFRNWTPSSADLANMVQQGLQTGSMADQIKYYNQKFKIPAAEELTPGNPNSPIADYGIFSAVSTNAALGIADKSFDNVAYIMQQINFLYRQLDQQQTLKQSADFSSVILLKIAALQADLIRLEAQQLKMLGVAQQQSNSKRTFAAQFVKDIE